jgi:hypothetical protein
MPSGTVHDPQLTGAVMKFVSRVLPALALLGLLAGHSPSASAASPKPAVISCTQVATATQLQAISRNLAGSYCLANDIDLASISNFVPIGNGPLFTGGFFGNGHVIRNLKISSTSANVGLFGGIADGRIQDVGLINANLNATGAPARVGGLVGFATSGSTIARVFVTGRVACKSSADCMAGGIVGDLQPGVTLADSWSSADVAARATTAASAGGVVGGGGGTITGSYATGNVSCTGTSSFCDAGGLVGGSGPVSQSFATGAVSAPQPSGFAGGLVGDILGQAIERSYATGPVSGDTAGGLVGQLRSGSSITESYAIGRVTGTTNAGGIAGHETNATPTASASYWDVNTTGQAASVVGTAATTRSLRARLPQGFDSFWAINKGRTFPFFNTDDIGFTSPLATLVRGNNNVFVFLPISQLDKSLYAGATAHISQASQATVYDMIARAIGLTDNIAQLKEARIDKYFWHDAKQMTTWIGPVLTHATLGKFVALAPSATLNPVLTQMKAQNLVILRGTYSTSGGTATHWMLGTMYLGSVVLANDPWTGTQVSIDVRTRKVTEPANFPLANFKVDGYQAVAVN